MPASISTLATPWLRPSVRSRPRPNARACSARLGGFGGLFDLKACGFKDPVLVAATDGVGTKLKLAIDTGIHDGIGIDLVAMNVNDIVVQGAEPLFFLDYFATGKLDLGVAETVIAGIARGCKEAGVRPDRRRDRRDAGALRAGRLRSRRFCRRRGRARMRCCRAPTSLTGDIILALPSSGVHANGFSLVRRVVEEIGPRAGATPRHSRRALSLGAGPAHSHAHLCPADP